MEVTYRALMTGIDEVKPGNHTGDIGAAIQENISGALIESGMQVAGDVRTYDFGPAITFWIGSSIVSMLLAATLWRVRLRE